MKKLSNTLQRQLSTNTQRYIDKELKFTCNNYSPLPVVIERGEGPYLYDVDQVKYLDFISSYSAVNQGHCHPKIVRALQEQAKKLTLTSRALHSAELAETAEYFTKLFNQDKILFMNTGVEATESSVKIARRWGYMHKKIPQNQAKVLFANGNFWGRSLAACASSDDPSRYTNFGPFDLNFQLIEYNNLKALEDALKADPNIAAYVFEPIQGEKGVIIPDNGYLKGVKDLCEKYNILMVCDEIQTGLGRTGKLLAVDHEDVKPDILVLGKALSGGMFPVSAVLCRSEVSFLFQVMDVLNPGSHGSTYGGSALASVVSRTAVQTLIEENMVENSAAMGKLLMKNLECLRDEKFIKDIRGRGINLILGLFCALEFREIPNRHLAYEFSQRLLEQGLLAKPTQYNTIRMSPSLVVNNNQINWASDLILKTIKSMYN